MAPALETALGLSHAEFGLLIAAYYAAMVALALPVGYLADRLGIVPMLVISHVVLALGMFVVARSQDLPSKLGHAYAWGQMWSATHRAARVITVSEASKRDILRYFRMPERQIEVIYNAIDDRFWGQPDAAEISRVGERYRLNDPFVLYAGNIKPHKNLERLIEAFHLMRQTARTWRTCSC